MSMPANPHRDEATSILALALIVFCEHTIRCLDKFPVAGRIVIAVSNTVHQFGYDLLTLQLRKGFECLRNALSSGCHKTKGPLWQPSVKSAS